MIRVLYFARFREKLGCEGESLALPTPATAQGLLEQLAARGGAWAEQLGPGRNVLVAVNQAIAGRDAPLAEGDEVAVFPPVTGG
jgi:molybdopterin synthase sulfur carrier subunit